MTIWVTAIEDLLDNAGEVLIPEGTRGTVQDATRPPAEITFQVDFTYNGVVVTKWVHNDKLSFDDGSIGRVRAFVEGEKLTVSSVSYVDPTMDHDPENERVQGNLNGVDLSFSNGRVLRMVADTATGTLEFEYK